MSTNLIYALVELTLAASVAILVVALVRKPMRRIAGAQVAYWLWLLVPASTLVVALPTPSWSLEIPTQVFSPVVLAASSGAAFSGNVVSAAADYTEAALVIWALGSLLMLTLQVRRQKAFIRSLGDLTPAQDGTYRSESVGGPVLLGVWRPRIVLPSDFQTLYGPEERALILAHEQAHRQRGDVLVNAIATIWLCLSWFNPLMYWALARCRFDQELACDAAVLKGAETARRRYADALLKTQLAADNAWRMPIGCHWQSNHPLKERIAMLKRPLPSLSHRLCGAALTCALIISGSVAVWAAQPEPPLAGQVGEEGQHFMFVADRISADLKDGKIELSGNAVVWLTTPDGPQMTWEAETVNFNDDGSTLLEGAVRFWLADELLTTERATLLKDGTIRMDSGSLSRTSKPR